MQAACRNQNETLMLDVLGELHDSSVRRMWEDHLRACDGCRRERSRMLQLLGKVREAGMPPELPAERADSMATAVGWRLRNERLARSGKTTSRRIRLIPALAAGCAFMVMLAVGYRLQDRLVGPVGGGDISAELQGQDFEVVKHLDLLKDMDTIEKLIHVVDIDSEGQGPDQAAPENQGMHRDASTRTHA
jgi:hypothetical protein